MSPRMSQGCALVLLLAMMLAMVAGLGAWGPIHPTPLDHMFAGERSWAGIPSTINTFACLPMMFVSLWGVLSAWHCNWRKTIRQPWIGFFVMCMLMSLSALLHHLTLNDGAFALAHAFAAASFIMLGLAFMAERMDELFGSPLAIAAGLGVAVCCAAWWFVGQWNLGHGDLRPMLFFEALPLLLIPAGALSLHGEHTTGSDWISSLGLYIAARIAGMADDVIYDWTGGLGGHALMHLLLAASTGCLTYRVSVAAASVAALSALPRPTQRRASLNTSS